MRNSHFAWTNCGKYLGGLLFVEPLLQPLLFWLIIYHFSKPNTKIEININRACSILFLVLLFIPVLILVNALSFHLLKDLSPQEIVTTIIEEDHISYTQVFSILVLSPLIEELYFRKTLLDDLCGRIGSLWSIFFTSFYFTIVHLNILSSPTLLVLGILLGVIYQKTKSVTSCIIVHAIFNFIMLCLMIYK